MQLPAHVVALVVMDSTAARRVAHTGMPCFEAPHALLAGSLVLTRYVGLTAGMLVV